MRGELEAEQNCNILTPTLMAITAFLSRSPALLNRGPGCPASLGHAPHFSIFSPTATAQSGAWGPPLLGPVSLYHILSPADWTSCASSYIIVPRSPSSCGRYKSRSFNPLYSDIPRPDTPVIYTGVFPILTAWPGSICYRKTSVIAWLVHLFQSYSVVVLGKTAVGVSSWCNG